VFETSIIGGFSFFVETASRKFSVFEMVFDAFATDSFSRTAWPSTGASFFVLSLFTFHFIEKLF